MPMTLTNSLLYTRQLYADTDTTNPALSDAELTRILNENYIRFRDHFSPRWVWESATTLTGTLAQADRKVTFGLTTIAEIKLVFVETAVGNVAGTPMTKDDLSRILTLQDADTTQAQPRIFALLRAGTFTAANIGKWTVYFWPIPNQAYYLSALVRYEVTELAVGADKADVTDGEMYTICRLAAADAALISGRPVELVQGILAPVPEKMKSHLALAVRSVKPQISQAGQVT